MPKETEAEKSDRLAQEEQARLDAENMGTGAAATDGQPNGDGNGVTDLDSRRGRTGAQLATDGADEPAATSEDPDGQQAWEPEPGKRVSLGSLVAKGKPVEYKTSVQGTGVKLKGGINDPAGEQVAVSRLYVEGYNIRYTRDSDGKIEKTIVTEIKVPRTIDPALSEAGQLVLENMGDAQEAAAG